MLAKPRFLSTLSPRTVGETVTEVPLVGWGTTAEANEGIEGRQDDEEHSDER